eukprot:2562190-Pleurochrysis_carterae.AAC.2
MPRLRHLQPHARSWAQRACAGCCARASSTANMNVSREPRGQTPVNLQSVSPRVFQPTNAHRAYERVSGLRTRLGVATREHVSNVPSSGNARGTRYKTCGQKAGVGGAPRYVSAGGARVCFVVRLDARAPLRDVPLALGVVPQLRQRPVEVAAETRAEGRRVALAVKVALAHLRKCEAQFVRLIQQGRSLSTAVIAAKCSRTANCGGKCSIKCGKRLQGRMKTSQHT